jgi:hypothetical protein
MENKMKKWEYILMALILDFWEEQFRTDRAIQYK